MSERTAGYQTWRHLLFVHWRVDADRIQKYLPQPLQPEVFDGTAWLGLVPFRMDRVRPWWSPPIPGVSWFLETNLRTYVRHSDGTTGVWFFSLDANQRLAVQVARTFWHLNYRYARMQIDVDTTAFNYCGRGKLMRYSIGGSLPANPDLRTAAPDSLEEFLLERYRLFARQRDGQFLTGVVHHNPYTFADVTVSQLEQTLTGDIDPASTQRAPDHVVYSPGVEVRVSPLQPVVASPAAVS